MVWPQNQHVTRGEGANEAVDKAFMDQITETNPSSRSRPAWAVPSRDGQGLDLRIHEMEVQQLPDRTGEDTSCPGWPGGAGLPGTGVFSTKAGKEPGKPERVGLPRNSRGKKAPHPPTHLLPVTMVGACCSVDREEALLGALASQPGKRVRSHPS